MEEWTTTESHFNLYLHFEMEKNTYIAAIQIVARLRIVMLDDTLLSLKNLVQFLQNVNHK